MGNIFILISSGIALLFLVFYFTLFVPLKEDNKRKEKDLNYYHTTYLSKQGGTSMLEGFDNLNYHLKSFDGGKNWYAIDGDKWFHDDEFIILGKVEDVYPGLIEHLDGMDKLTEYVTKYGPIGSCPITDKDAEILENAGFEIQQKN